MTIREIRSLLASARRPHGHVDTRAHGRRARSRRPAGRGPGPRRRSRRSAAPSFDPDEVAQAILDGLGDGVDDEVRTMVLGAVLAGDERDAIIDAAALVVADHAATAAARLARRADDRRHGASSPSARRAAGRDGRGDVRRRSATSPAGPDRGPPSPACCSSRRSAALVGLSRLHRRDRHLAWVAGRRSSSPPASSSPALARRVAAAVALAARCRCVRGPDGWGLPPATATLVADVPRGRRPHHRGRLALQRGARARRGRSSAAGAGSCATRCARRRRGASPARIGDRRARRVQRRRRHAAARRAGLQRARRAVRPPLRRGTSAATHNSMSSPDVVPVWPEHDGGITAQLDAGVRALLIDTHHWPPLDVGGPARRHRPARRAGAPAGPRRRSAARPGRRRSATAGPARSSATSTARSVPSRSSTAWPRSPRSSTPTPTRSSR